MRLLDVRFWAGVAVGVGLVNISVGRWTVATVDLLLAIVIFKDVPALLRWLARKWPNTFATEPPPKCPKCGESVSDR